VAECGGSGGVVAVMAFASVRKSSSVRSLGPQDLGPRPVFQILHSLKDWTEPVWTGLGQSFAVPRPVRTGLGSDQFETGLNCNKYV